ncbi:MAG: GtrA family protein [Prevotellaceae bacterium]|jgi:putative flippase GtrA|nr:GtrA family protein [Prevotellaceae bacterium]
MLERLRIFIKAQLSAFIGGACDYLAMIFFTEVVGLHYVLSTVAGCILGAIVNFSLNKAWAFYSTRSIYRFSFSQQLWRFLLVFVGGVLLKAAGTGLLTQLAQLDYRVSRIATDIPVALLFNYVLQRYWVFRKNKRKVIQPT